MLLRTQTIALVAVITGCAPTIETGSGRTEAGAAQLTPGLSRDGVTRALGAPQGFLTERNGVECLIYVDRDNSYVIGTPVKSPGRERVVVLKDGKLVEHQLIATGSAPGVSMQMPGQATSASTCSAAAARFEPTKSKKS